MANGAYGQGIQLMHFGTRMRVLRAVLGLSQKNLAEVVDIPNTNLSDIETGRVMPAEAWDQRIRAALGWTPAVDAALDALAVALASEREEAA
jgi:DNA-binding XRE family transcriptional regulator